jgi:oxygen-independent coproporphyrinogen III oxidase
MSALYLHLPWCRSKCGYCDFYSLPTTDGALVARTGRALLKEADAVHAAEGRPPLASLYVGGGTPSLLPAAFFSELLHRGRPLGAALEPKAEITVEMNPESVRPGWLEALARAGVTRASLGLQSFDPRQLAFLEREHLPGTVRRVVREVRQAGIPGLGLDLIYQLPGQDAVQLDRELDQLLELAPEHVSAYGLSWEAGTPLAARQARGDGAPLEADRAAELYLQLSARLQQAGYLHYEVSNFALPGAGGRHNSRYWAGEAVLAAGPGSVGNRAFDDTEAGRPERPLRWKRNADWRSWLDAVEAGREAPWCADEAEPEARLLERVFCGLRWIGGLSLAGIEAGFGRPRRQRLEERATRPALAAAFAAAAGETCTRETLAALFGPGGGPPPLSGPQLRLGPVDWLLLDEIVVDLCR